MKATCRKQNTGSCCATSKGWGRPAFVLWLSPSNTTYWILLLHRETVSAVESAVNTKRSRILITERDNHALGIEMNTYYFPPVVLSVRTSVVSPHVCLDIPALSAQNHEWFRVFAQSRVMLCSNKKQAPSSKICLSCCKLRLGQKGQGSTLQYSTRFCDSAILRQRELSTHRHIGPSPSWICKDCNAAWNMLALSASDSGAPSSAASVSCRVPEKNGIFGRGKRRTREILCYFAVWRRRPPCDGSSLARLCSLYAAAIVAHAYTATATQ